MVGQRAADLVVGDTGLEGRTDEPLGDARGVARLVDLAREHGEAAHDALHLRHGDRRLDGGLVGATVSVGSAEAGGVAGDDVAGASPWSKLGQ